MQFYAVLSNACEFLGRHILVTQEVDFRMIEKQQIAKKLLKSSFLVPHPYLRGGTLAVPQTFDYIVLHSPS